MHLGRVIKELVPEQKQVIDDQGNVFTYGKLLLATGGRPRRFPFGNDRIIYYRTLADYRRLRALTETGEQFAVIGGGFIGSEIAAALALNGKQVALIFPGKEIGERLFPRALAQFVSNVYRDKGVELLPGEKVVAWESRGDQNLVKTGSGREIAVDGVVAGIGLEPNIELAQSAGIKTEKEIVVDEFLRSSDPDIYAAGDVAEFYNPALEKRLRVEHEDKPTRWDGWRGATWRAGLSLMIICLSFTPTCSIWDTRRWAKSMRGWRHLPTGSGLTKKASSTI